ncbi:hypothetical protein [Aureimonas sp. AU12]|uniref:hypothetical protein n=1 Tax=Aureimonas sp. AU12 TaxID=1638161 RepID=UPI00078565B0|nr:hypothetical protein [Aureimonas sp. AU12]
MATLVTVLRSGGRYDGIWVERLVEGFRRHAPAFDRFVCLTDLALDLPGVECIALRHDWPAWWSKMEAFRPGLFTGTVLLCDLDTVIAGDASALAQPGLAAMEDHFHKHRLSSALLRWDGDELAFLYDAFAAEPERWMTPGACGQVPNAVHGDQVVIDHLLRKADRRPAFFQSASPGLLEFYDPARSHYDGVVIFIGDAKPDLAGEPIASLWAGRVRGPA